MSNRPLQVVAVMLLAAAVLWALNTPRKATSDEARYRQWQRPIDSWVRVVFVERHIPSGLSTVLRLPALEQRYLDKYERISEALKTSGYLTNVHIAMSNAGSQRTQIAAPLRRATQASGAKWEFYVRSNTVVVLTCRPQDVASCVRAIESN
jgi:hypothetical protein